MTNAPARIALLLCLVCALLPSQATSDTRENSSGLGDALAAINDGDDKAAAVLLEQSALSGDERAQYLLGALYFTSKVLPANKPLGYAWLELAADATGPYHHWSSRQAVDMMAKVENMMTGTDLVEADRLAEILTERVGTARAAAIRPALDVYTRVQARVVGSYVELAAPESHIAVAAAESRNPLLRLGCAILTGSDCPAASASAPTARCTGLIPRGDDQSPAKATEFVQSLGPAYPSRGTVSGVLISMKARKKPVFVVHVDASGWVCSAALAVSSGNTNQDRRSIDAVRAWRMVPATRDGQPVEALYVVSVETYEPGFDDSLG